MSSISEPTNSPRGLLSAFGMRMPVLLLQRGSVVIDGATETKKAPPRVLRRRQETETDLRNYSADDETFLVFTSDWISFARSRCFATAARVSER